jgi:hypothetical protein
MLKIDINFEENSYDDMPPEHKSGDELALWILENAAGKMNYIPKYSDREVNIGARYLINHGYLRGTVLGWEQCSWSRLTRKGDYLREMLKLIDN